LHDWIVDQCNGRDRLAAALTTLAILLILLLPLTWVLFRAISEGLVLAHTFEKHQPVVMQGLENAVAAARKLSERIGVEVPENQELVDVARTKLQEAVRQFLAPAALGGVQYVFGILVGLAIMVLALYYFLADGPAMIRTIMRLSPLEERYEQQLLSEFVKISRAVVVAALLSAFVQGLLAGVGFYFAGLHAIFMLMALTMLLALVPFVGAAAVWVPCSAWLYMTDHHGAAIMLAIYGATIVSMADNVIKPIVLHGQSGIHPLVALLSILGGVTALGPIGILVGPMLVAFLQALLNMLNAELESMAQRRAEKAAT
jgi:predicted PurR-regulated permease PerM